LIEIWIELRILCQLRAVGLQFLRGHAIPSSADHQSSFFVDHEAAWHEQIVMGLSSSKYWKHTTIITVVIATRADQLMLIIVCAPFLGII